jgi:hypothetical protein
MPSIRRMEGRPSVGYPGAPPKVGDPHVAGNRPQAIRPLGVPAGAHKTTINLVSPPPRNVAPRFFAALAGFNVGSGPRSEEARTLAAHPQANPSHPASPPGSRRCDGNERRALWSHPVVSHRESEVMREILAGVALLLASALAPALGQGSIWLAAAQAQGLDPLVLYAIALQESRRLSPDGRVRPWPWTLHVRGRGALRFETYREAAHKLTDLIGVEGVTNVDIGIMQINWRANGHRLLDPAQILLPNNNIRLGARILRENLKRARGDLVVALGRYHSPHKDRGRRYAESVLSILEGLKAVRGFALALVL